MPLCVHKSTNKTTDYNILIHYACVVCMCGVTGTGALLAKECKVGEVYNNPS